MNVKESLQQKVSRLSAARDNQKAALIALGRNPSDAWNTYADELSRIVHGDGMIQFDKTITPTATGMDILPDAGYDALYNVILQGDPNLQSWNIRYGINIFGVEGTVVHTPLDAGESGGVVVPDIPGSTIIPNTPEHTVNPSTPDMPAIPYDPDKPEEMEVPKNIIEKVSGQKADTFDVMLLEDGTGDITYGFMEKSMLDYNGTVLPALPEWDKTAYPYAVIMLIGSTYYLFLNSEPLSWKTVMLNTYQIILSGNTARSTIANGAWTTPESVERDYANATSKSDVIWVNVDVMSASGQTVIFAASTPSLYGGFEITLYDPATTNFKAKGWRRLSYHRQGDYWQSDDFTTVESGGWNYLKHITECTREKLYYKGVEVWPNCSQTWSYNGVVLPALLDLEYNGNTYPYVFMVKEKVSSIPYCVRASMDKTYIQEGQLSDGRITESIYINYPFLLTRHSENPNDVWSYYDNDLEQYVYGEWTRHTSEEWGNKPSAPTMTISIDGEPTGANIIWSNHDILYPDGTVFFAASDPIPIK